MKTKEEILNECLPKDTAWYIETERGVQNAMEEYGKLMYNQAIQDAADNADADLEIIDKQGLMQDLYDTYGWREGLDYEIGINRGSILKLLKK